MYMQIWIDADACPNPIKTILFRAAIRTKILLLVVANHEIYAPPSLYIKKYQVAQGFDAADQYIVANLQAGDLVITADIPLADAVVSKGGWALNPRGELYTANNIKQHLAIRNRNESLRSSNQLAGGPPKLNEKDVRDFANGLDSLLAKSHKNI